MAPLRRVRRLDYRVAPVGLADLRADIDEVDRRIIGLIEDRIQFAREAGEVKRAAGIPITDIPREREIIEKYRRTGTGRQEALTRIIAMALIDLAKAEQQESPHGS